MAARLIQFPHVAPPSHAEQPQGRFDVAGRRFQIVRGWARALGLIHEIQGRRSQPVDQFAVTQIGGRVAHE